MFNQILGDEQRRVGKWASIALLLLSAFLLVQVVVGLKKIPNVGKEIYPQSTIMANGTGEAFAIPDVASFSFTVTEASEDVASAQGLLDKKIAQVLGDIKEAGIEDKDIKTTSYNVYPKYEWNQVQCFAYPCPQGKNELIGYEVTQTILVKVRETAKAGELVSKVGESNVSNISGLEFTIDDREKYVAEARKQAIEKAKEEAKLLAKQLGVRLGKMMYYTDNNGYPMPYYGAEMGMGGDMKAVSAPTRAELPAGETKITSNITITYEIK